jgi:endonuclease/exonuclease/phosphatase family metal-dependent hydrolase
MSSLSSLVHKAALTLAVPLALIVSILLGLSSVAQFFNPLQAEFMPLLGLFFPVFFILTMVIFLLLAFFLNRFAFLPLFFILAVLPIANLYIGKNSRTTSKNQKLITFNVHGFRTHGGFGSSSSRASDIAAFISNSGADFVCIQEFRSWSGDIINDIHSFVKETGLEHFSHSIYWPKGKSSSDIHLIISRFPIIKSGSISARTGRNIGHFADFTTDEGNMRLVSVHLISFSLDKNELSMLSQGDMLDRKTVQEYGPKLSGKLTSTFRIRALETEDLLRFVNKSALPVVLAGDFNDTPASYTHRSLRRAGFTDTHPRHGKGFGSTYAGRIPFLRIDYVFLSPTFEADLSTVYKIKFSDHFPVAVTFGKL